MKQQHTPTDLLFVSVLCLVAAGLLGFILYHAFQP